MDKIIHSKILILFAHPAIHKSRVNIELIKPLQNLTGITFHDLYESYPDFYIDVKKEQSLLVEHDIIAFMHPLYWYSIPSILKEWIDLVLEHGFAYGEKGTALQGKKCVSVITTAGTQEGYQHDGIHRFSIPQLLAPIDQTAVLCGMKYLPPFVIHNTLQLTPTEIANHTEHLKTLLVDLQNNQIDYSSINELSYLNNLHR
jgi:glutathione-regulated potassium-efflux system ancillary protein KefG